MVDHAQEHDKETRDYDNDDYYDLWWHRRGRLLKSDEELINFRSSVEMFINTS